VVETPQLQRVSESLQAKGVERIPGNSTHPPGTKETEEQRKERLREKYKDFRSKSLADATRILPEVLIEGIQYLTRRMLMAGASKSRKSFFCLQMAFCCSKGLSLFGRFLCRKSA
jgi:hypothetical protein